MKGGLEWIVATDSGRADAGWPKRAIGRKNQRQEDGERRMVANGREICTVVGMSSVIEIESAVEKLSPQQVREFAGMV